MITIPSAQHASTIQPHQCLGVVLAGGLSARMGVDKASLQRNQVNMLNYSKQLLTDSGIKNIVISGEPACATSQDILVADKHKAAGPIGGIASVIATYQPTALLILPVDLPLLTANHLQKLKQVGELSQQACFYHDNFLPLYLPVTAHCEQFLSQAFTQHDHASCNVPLSASKNIPQQSPSRKSGPSMRALLKQVPHTAIAIDTPTSLLNANTPDEWKNAQQHFITSSTADQYNNAALPHSVTTHSTQSNLTQPNSPLPFRKNHV